MKAILPMLAIAAHAFAGDRPIDLSSELAAARAAWGYQIEVRSVVMKPINACRGLNETAGFADLVARTITLNSNCHWTADLIRIAIEHEYGHLLWGSVSHDEDRHSVMFWQIRRGQRITAFDREMAARSEESRRLRPSILRGNYGGSE